MKSWSGDVRFVLVVLAAAGVEATGRQIEKLLHRASRVGRMEVVLRRLEKLGFVGRSGAGPMDGRVFQITERGRAALAGVTNPEVLWNRNWDGAWRLAMFDVPQAQASARVRLRRKLHELRFGWLQNSVWLSPDPVSQLVRELTQAEVAVESLLFIEGRPAGGESDAQLVAGAWDFARLGRLHEEYLKMLRTRPPAGRKAKSAEWMAWLAAEDRAWQAVLRADPLLPAALLPETYAGRAAWAARREALSLGADSFADILASE